MCTLTKISVHNETLFAISWFWKIHSWMIQIFPPHIEFKGIFQVKMHFNMLKCKHINRKCSKTDSRSWITHDEDKTKICGNSYELHYEGRLRCRKTEDPLSSRQLLNVFTREESPGMTNTHTHRFWVCYCPDLRGVATCLFFAW